MSKVLWNYLLVIPALFGGLVVLSSATLAAEVEKTTQPTQQVIPIEKITPTAITQSTSPESSFEPSVSRSKVPVLAVPSDRMEQVTSVSQLSDVNPTDWAFQALQSLVERYGVITGYPDGTFNSKPKSFLEALPSKHFSQSQGYHKTTFYSAFQKIPLATFKRSL